MTVQNKISSVFFILCIVILWVISIIDIHNAGYKWGKHIGYTTGMKQGYKSGYQDGLNTARPFLEQNIKTNNANKLPDYVRDMMIDGVK